MAKNDFIKKIFLAGTLLALCASCSSKPYVNVQASLPVLTGKPDGVYRGEYDLEKTPVKVSLDVTLRNQAITAIQITKHFCSPIGKKAEKITARVIERQSLDVDSVSGATGSSKAILKAIENALQ